MCTYSARNPDNVRYSASTHQNQLTNIRCHNPFLSRPICKSQNHQSPFHTFLIHARTGCQLANKRQHQSDAIYKCTTFAKQCDGNANRYTMSTETQHRSKKCAIKKVIPDCDLATFMSFSSCCPQRTPHNLHILPSSVSLTPSL